MRAPERRRAGSHIPTLEGRELLVRPSLFGEGMQLAIVGKQGGIVEAAGVGADQLAGLLFAIDGISELVWAQQQVHLCRRRRERERRHAAALARNPWLKKQRREREVV